LVPGNRQIVNNVIERSGEYRDSSSAAAMYEIRVNSATPERIQSSRQPNTIVGKRWRSGILVWDAPPEFASNNVIVNSRRAINA